MGLIDLVLLAIVLYVTWNVASEGAWDAVATCLSVIFAGMLAMNFFEPCASFMERSFSSSPPWSLLWDPISLVGLFIVFYSCLRFANEYLAPTYISIPGLANDAGRWAGGVLTGYVTMAFLLTALHTAPLPREFLGFRPERKNFLSVCAPDRQWLGFTQYVSEKPFRQSGQGRIFDGPRFELGDQPNDIWPSFPIRYATRRELYATGGAVAGNGPSVRRRVPKGTRSTQPQF